MIIEEVPSALAGERLDRIVALMLDVSRSTAATVIEAGGASVDGEVVTTGKLRLQEGQQVVADPDAVPVAGPPRADDSVEDPGAGRCAAQVQAGCTVANHARRTDTDGFQA